MKNYLAQIETEIKKDFWVRNLFLLQWKAGKWITKMPKPFASENKKNHPK
jgi:hypothetical protein